MGFQYFRSTKTSCHVLNYIYSTQSISTDSSRVSLIHFKFKSALNVRGLNARALSHNHNANIKNAHTAVRVVPCADGTPLARGFLTIDAEFVGAAMCSTC
jgi:hypothetical protein